MEMEAVYMGEGRVKGAAMVAGMGSMAEMEVVEGEMIEMAAGTATARGRLTGAGWRSLRRVLDEMDGPPDEARSLANFHRVMTRWKAQQDEQQQRWRWVRRVAGAIAALAGASAVRMLTR